MTQRRYVDGLAVWKKYVNQSYGITGLLFVVALILRSFRLANNPMWLDELYGYQLGQRGLEAILRNSYFVPHPPMFYVLQYVASGFGTFHSEWGWRWLSVVSGAISV